jgi:antirestriction protein ArdC
MPRKTKSRRRRKLSEEERAEKRAADRALMAEAVETLRSSEGWQRWLDLRRYFRDYSCANQFLIACQMPEARRVTGFRKWLTLGYAVRKGETAIRIWAPIPPSKEMLEDWRKAGADPKTKPKTYFRMVAVFDRSQVDPLPDFPGGAVDLEPPCEPIEGDGLAGYLPSLKGFAAAIGFSFVVKEMPARVNGYCAPTEREIAVRPVEENYSPNAQVKTGVHEVSHALVRVGRCEEDPKLSRDEEEVVVECVAYLICSTLGLDTSGYSVTYVASWGSGAVIERYAELIDRLASRIEDALLADGQLASASAPADRAPIVA